MPCQHFKDVHSANPDQDAIYEKIGLGKYVWRHIKSKEIRFEFDDGFLTFNGKDIT